MVVDTIKENLCVNKLVATKKEVILVEEIWFVPDSKPDILNTICSKWGCMYLQKRSFRRKSKNRRKYKYIYHVYGRW